LDQNWHSLFTGLDLRGWLTNALTQALWSVENERIVLRQGTANPEPALYTDAEFGDAEFVIDCRNNKPGSGQDASVPELILGSRVSAGLRLQTAKRGEYERFLISIKGREVTIKPEHGMIEHVTLAPDLPTRRRVGLGAGAAAEFMNLYVRDLGGKN
jgi:hypothetical protein